MSFFLLFAGRNVREASQAYHNCENIPCEGDRQSNRCFSVLLLLCNAVLDEATQGPC